VSPAKRWTLVAAILGSAVVFLDATVVTVALPAIGRDLPRSFLGVLEGETYVYNGYLLTLSALLILGGALSDYYGRRRIFLIGLVGFAVASTLCGLAPTLELLVAFRLLQGVAGAILVPGSLSLLTAVFSGEERGRVFGIWAGASAAIILIGPYVGGQLVELLSWRVIFLVNLPIAAVAVWATVVGVAETRDEASTGHFDWLGAAVLALAVGGLSFGAIYGQQREWQAPLAWAALAVGVLATVAFPFLMARRPNPLVPLDLFRSRNFTVTNLSTLLIYGALYVTGYYLPIFTQGVLGYSAAAAGAALVPGFLFLVFFSSTVGSLAARHGPRRFMVLGPLLMAGGVVWYANVPADSAPLRLDPGGGVGWLLAIAGGILVARFAIARAGAIRVAGLAGGSLIVLVGLAGAIAAPATQGYARDLLPGQLVYGFGATLMVAPLTTALMASVPVARSGLASAINNAVSRVGPQLAGAAIFVAITATFYGSLAMQVSGLDVTSPSVRSAFPPLNRPIGDVSPGLLHAAATASTDGFHVAMLIAVGLLLAGAVINAVGIRDPEAAERGAPPDAGLVLQRER
jgi:EmrB/QacA subfamily drug resistance transporter